MFYGKGAGSLPTASAVVSDVVDCIKRRGETADILWKSTKRNLGSADAFSTPYFVRVKGEGLNAEVEAAFGDVQYVTAEGITGETAFFTKTMTGSEFEKAASSLEVVSRIRVSE